MTGQNRVTSSSSLWTIGMVFSVFLLGIVLGNMSGKSPNYSSQDLDSSGPVRQFGYEFINPLLECEIDGEKTTLKYIPFEKNATAKIKEEVMAKNPDTHLSVYFRNLDNGPRFGINENEEFSPASLMKVPLLIAYLKWKEQDSTLFAKELTALELPEEVTQNIKPDQPIVPGNTYSVQELVRHLIVSSDNIASVTLAANIPENFLLKVYNDLGIPLPKSGEAISEDYISVKDYASFFRTLYNSSYLDRESSEEALRLLSKTNFSDGIRKPIPSGTVIAHKFGERKIISPDSTINQLHDCGIVYYKKYPYLLCVMTKGKKELSELAPIIQQTSKIIFDEVKNSYQ